MMDNSFFSVLLSTTASSVLFTANHRASLPDQFVESVGVAGSDAASPTNHSKEKYTGHHRLIKDLHHLAAHFEGSQLPQEVNSAHPLLVHSFCIRSPVQSVVDGNTQVLVRRCLYCRRRPHWRRRPH